MELIPNLPDDVGLECLIRVSFDRFHSVASVCRRWKLELERPEFWRRRKIAGLSQKVVVMVQARVDSDPNSAGSCTVKSSADPVYRISVCEPASGKWSELEPLPGFPNGLPMFCRVVGVGLDLVVLGGWNRVTWEVSNAVFVYNFVSATWRRGSDMPGGPRSFFACASDSNRTVFVAGGHDKEKNALRSAMAYDVGKNEWKHLPDMATDRDECKGVYHRGRFHVIGGYNTEMQGQFGTSAEAFDVATWKWDQLQHDFLETATCPATCLDGGDGKMYMCRANDVVARGNSTWQKVAELPAEVRSTVHVTAWHGKMLVVGSQTFGGTHNAYLLDLKSLKWTKVAAPAGFSGHVQSGCWMDI
ncbi:hypothetical protein NMG60_11004981 [Bertholletia excelsa]